MKKLTKRMRRIAGKINIIGVMMLSKAHSAFADGINSSILATGTSNLISDVTTWITGIGIAMTVMMVVYCLMRRNMADEMDHKKWQSRMIVSLVSGIGIVVASSVINVLVSYYQ